MRQQLEQALAFHCGPALAGIKPANLVSLSNADYPNLLSLVDWYNRQLNRRGIYLTVLRQCRRSCLVLVYRRKKLCGHLLRPEHHPLLAQAGYPATDNLELLLHHLCHRLAVSRDFPHEIGLFLGYPLEDVIGFRENNGQNFLFCGHWKVYGDVDCAQRLFHQYDRCRNSICRHVKEGLSLTQLFRAA